MKLSSVTSIALLSGLSVAAPGKRDDGCGAAVTVTITSTQNINVAAPAAPTVTVIVDGGTSGGSTSGGSSGSNFVGVNVENAPGNTGNTGGPNDTGSGFHPNINANNAAANSVASPGNTGGPNDTGSGFNANVAVNNGAGGTAMVTQYNQGDDGSQTVRACPTGQTNYDCFEAVYGSNGAMVTVNIISITVTTINGEVTTQTITKDGNGAKVTPAPAKANNDDSSWDEIVTQVVDVTETITKNGKTVTSTNTHHTTFRGTGTGSASNSAPTHFVDVGKDGSMNFDPSTVSAKAGDTVRFTFFPLNHTVTSCSFDSPCVADNGFDSGFKHTFIRNSTTFIDYPVTSDNAPLHFFSKQDGECKQGMVFGINPDKFDEFVQRAKDFDASKLTSPMTNSTTNGTISNNSLNSTDPNVNGTANLNDTQHQNDTGTPTSFGGKRSLPIQLTEREAVPVPEPGHKAVPASRRWFF